MIRKTLRYCLACAALCLVSCGPFPELTMEDVSIYTDLDANQNSAIATDLVIAYSEDLVKKLGKMPACTYFASSQQLLMDNPTLLDIWHWEFVPGQSVEHFAPYGEKGKAYAAYVFANYLSPGNHRVKVSPNGNIAVVLMKNDLKDISTANARDIRAGSTTSQLQESNKDLPKWPIIGQIAGVISSDDSLEGGIKAGPVTSTTLIASPSPCTVQTGTKAPICIKPLPYQGSSEIQRHHRHHHHKGGHKAHTPHRHHKSHLHTHPKQR